MRALLLGAALATTALASPSLTLVYTADIHGAIASRDPERGGAARLGGYLQRLRRRALYTNSRLLLVHAGDAFQGTPVVNRTEGACMPPVLAALGMHLNIPGNHEWDYGPEAYHRLELAPRPFMLSSNIQGLGRGTRPAASMQVGAAKVGFLGYTLPSTPLRAPPGATEGLEFLGGAALHAQADRLRRLGATCLVLITHTDRSEAEQLGQAIGADFVIGAHTNEVIPPKRLSNGTTWYAQAGWRLEHAGWATLEFDSTGRMIHLSGAVDPLEAALAPADPKVTDVVRPLVEELEREFARPITTLAAAIPKGSWSGHSPLVAAVAHAVREASGADLAVMNPQICRAAALGPGVLTGNDLYEALPYENRIAVLQLDAGQLDELYEDLVKSAFKPFKEAAQGAYSTDYRGILQPSGFEVRITPSAPLGARVELRLPGGGPLLSTRTYSVATSDYMATGGDGYLGLQEAPQTALALGVRDSLSGRLARLGADASRGPGGLWNLSRRDPGP